MLKLKTILTVVITAIVTVIVVLLVEWCLLARKPTKRGIKKESTTMKKVVWLCLANGICWVWCSYGLAWFGREQIAESLSQVAITEIIGVVLVYALKALAENLSKHNNWPDKGKNTQQCPDDSGQG